VSWNPYTDWVQIGDRYWSSKNVDILLEGVTTTGMPRSTLWNGVVYYGIGEPEDWAALEAALPAGWRLPTYGDWVLHMLPTVGGSSVAGTALKDETFGGADTYGFGLEAVGWLQSYYGEVYYPQDSDLLDTYQTTPPDPIPVFNKAAIWQENGGARLFTRTGADAPGVGMGYVDLIALRAVRNDEPPPPPADPPTVRSVTPYQAARGFVVTIEGANLDKVTSLELTGGAVLPIRSQSFGSISFVVPFDAEPGTYSLDLNWLGGTVTAGGIILSDLSDLPAFLPPDRSAADYTGLLVDLLPKGPAWTRKPSSYLAKLLGACSDELARIHDRAADLLKEATPSHAVESLPEWETELGVPGPCIQATSPTESRRRWEIFRKANSLGGCTVVYLQELAALFGYTIEVVELYPDSQPFKVGQAKAGDTLNQGPALFTFQVNVDLPAGAISDFRAGLGTAGQPLRWWALEELECLIDSVKPAHTLAAFNYTA